MQPCEYIRANYPVKISTADIFLQICMFLHCSLSVTDISQIFYRTDMYICHICQFGKGKYFLSFMVNNITGIEHVIVMFMLFVLTG